MSRKLWRVAAAAILMQMPFPAMAQSSNSAEIEMLKAQLSQMQQQLYQLQQSQAYAQQAAQQAQYQAQLQAQLQAQQAAQTPAQPQFVQSNVTSNDNTFNPAIGAILNGRYSSFSRPDNGIAGFGLGEEASRSDEGFSLDESELNLRASVDDRFTANLTAALALEDGETVVELEEAFIRTLGLPNGFAVQAGRSFLPIGYLNENHEHTDDFADRPLPNRAFLGGAYRDNGVLASWIAPTKKWYAQLGGGAFQGNDFPVGGNSGGDAGAYLGYAKIGGDFSKRQNWLLSFSALKTTPGERSASDGDLLFRGDSNLYTAGLRYIWAPTGNPNRKEVILQGEYFLRDEDGEYNDTDVGTGYVPYNGDQSGWYAQAVYKWTQQWRVGARYSEVDAGSAPAGLSGTLMDASGHKPWNAAAMIDWSRSEFSRIRLQYQHEEASAGNEDDQIVLQYIMSLGAHPAHSF